MRCVVQVCKHARCIIDEKEYSSINRGYLIFVGFTYGDNEEIMHKMIDKILSLRLFLDENGKTNLSLGDLKGEVMCISQFTLYGDVKKGRRPSFTSSLNKEVASSLYDKTIAYLKEKINTAQGVFGADMKIELVNDGPFTLIIDSEDL